jgi:hypothetical protein
MPERDRGTLSPDARLNNLVRIVDTIQEKLRNLTKAYVSKETANDSVLLQAPDKSVWIVKVTNAGALTVTKVSG